MNNTKKAGRLSYFLFALYFAFFLCSCSGVTETADYHNPDVTGSVHQTDSKKKPKTVASLKDIPDYSGNAYVNLNAGQPDFSAKDKKKTKAFETYSKLDSLGRCGAACANICPEIMPTEERGSIGQVKPSGWHTVKYRDLIDGNYLYNRCHLIGYQLAGENANEKNLITGTRYLNVEGMLPFEDLVAEYVKKTGNHVLYRVTPVFQGKNLVASGVEMEAWSVEDSGSGVCFHVYCYNVQPGIVIDYASGESKEAAGDAAPEKKTARERKSDDGQKDRKHSSEALSGEEIVTDYVLNTNTKRIHLPTCFSVSDTKEQNRKTCKASIRELKEKGYTPCGNCLASYRD